MDFPAAIIEDWQINKSFAERNKMMLERQLYTDVNFVFEEKGEGQSKPCVLRAHKYMLISSSPVFFTMLTGVLAEEGDILIEDVEYETFADMLKFIYCEELHLTEERVMHMIYASMKYMVPAITSKCTAFLAEKLTFENTCTMLEQALFLDAKELVEQCLLVVKLNTADIFGSEDFKESSRPILDQILQLEQLSVPEVEVFQACLKWAHSKERGNMPISGENVREILGDLIYRIRFPAMTTLEFSSVVSPTGVLSHMEELACFRLIGNPQHKEDNQPFLTDKRILFQSWLYCGLQEPYEMSEKLIHLEVVNVMIKWHISSAIDPYFGVPPVTKKLRGLRIVCEENDAISLALSSASLSSRAVDRNTQENEAINVWDWDAQETLCEVVANPVHSVSKENGVKFTDIYFPEKNADIMEDRDYLLHITFNHGKRVSLHTPIAKQYVSVERMTYCDEELFISAINLTENQGKTCVLGIFLAPKEGALIHTGYHF